MRSNGMTKLAMAACLMALSVPSVAADAKRETAGKLKDGTEIEAITLTNKKGVSARILTYGATLQSLLAPDRKGKLADVVLGHDELAPYVDTPNFWGVTVGRFANRIAGGQFKLDGKTYNIQKNDTNNSLHGGAAGFDKKVWKVASVESGKVASVTLTLNSPDGDSGYPGNLEVTTTYTLDEKGDLGIEFKAKTDKPTIVNMTNHAIFNMAGEGSRYGILNQLLTIPASHYTPVDDVLIPTGELRAVAGTPFDFRKPRLVGEAIRDASDPQIRIGRGYDHNFAIDGGLTKAPKLLARLEDPESGRVLEALSTEPGVQFYTGNFLTGILVGKKGHLYRMGDGLALEPQKFPDAPNKPSFASARIDAQNPYYHKMIYRLSVKR